MKNAVFFKTFSGYLLTALGLAALVLFFSFRTIRQYYLNTLTNDLRDLCVAVEPQALTYIASHDPAGLDGFIKKLEVQTHKRITVLDGRGAVIADSENDPKTMPGHRDRPEVARALGGNVGSSLRYSSTIMENMLYVAVPVEEEDGTIVGVVRASMHLKDVNALLQQILVRVAFITGMIVIFSLFIAFYDSFRVRNLETKKKEFVANVSHELRTPLTAIKGFVETAEDEVSPEGRRYLEIIKRHTERLINIVEDLLQLSSLEKKGFTLELSRVDLREILDNTLKVFEEKAKRKNIAVNVEVREDLRPVEADRFRIEQMLINLIDNALKYTEKGAITVALGQDDGQTTITVSDTGIGIAREHIPCIFERFYVVDKSRSRKLGGTGLGLSIVKHIVLLHKGSIDVESAPNRGTRFTVTLPCR
jgi:signal transduction histidine kinase